VAVCQARWRSRCSPARCAPDPLDEAESLASVRFRLDAIAATPVPAPGGLPLAGLALGLLAVCRSRFILIGRAQDGQKT
jgi:hypothetical protein